jgi:phage FluMu protein Com
MITFSCEHCGHKVSAQDEDAGKHGKCPRCAGEMTVPEKSILVNFLCDNCGEKISAIHTRGGKEGKCPKCKTMLAVPVAHDLTLLDMEKIEEIKRQQRMRDDLVEQADEGDPELEAESSDQIELIDERKLPWFIDIFLYPLSVPGLIHLAIFIGVLPAISFLQSLVPGLVYTFFWLGGWVVKVILFLYMYWYIAACIRDSAEGWVRAPEGLGAIPDFEDLFWQGVNVIGCFGILFGPALLYVMIAGRAGLVFWLLSGVALFLYPMSLLAAVMFDSPGAIGPALLFRSISGTFSSYCGLVLLFTVVGVLVTAIMTVLSRSPLVGYILGAVCIYLAMMTAHLTGRFYWRNQKELGWQV